MSRLIGSAGRDANRAPVTFGVSTADGKTVLPIEIDPVTGQLQVNSTGGSTIPISGATTAEAVAIVDASGNQITSFGGGTQYTDAASTPTHPIGTMPIWDNGGTLSKTSLTSGLPVQPATGASFGSSSADGSGFTQNSTTGGISMGVYVASPQTLTTGKAGAIAVDINRNTLVNIATINGTAPTTAGKIDVIGTKTNNSATVSTQLGVLPAMANAAAPSWTENYDVKQSVDLSGNQRVTQGTLMAGENLTTNRINNEPVYSYLYVVTAATTQVKTGAGTLHTITVQGGTAGTIIAYDNTTASGTIIASFDSTAYPQTYLFDLSFATGLCIITAANTKYTVTYR
jgi:hypothetical protein